MMKMHTIRESVDTLVGLGLTGTQARIILSLAGKGKSTIREISEASGIARPDTYRAVLELVNKSLIEKTVSTPTKYNLISLHDVISILVGRREIESLELQDKSSKLLKEYEKKVTNEQATNDSQFALVTSGEALSNRITKLIEKSQKSICLILSQKALAQFFDRHLKKLEKAMKKGVHLRIITEKRKNSLPTTTLIRLQKTARLEVRYLTIISPFSIITFDEKEILLSTTTLRANKNEDSVYSNNSSLVELSQNYFNDAWFSAAESPHQQFKHDRLQFDYLFANLINGFAYCKMIFDDENKPVDFVYLQINTAFERITGLNRQQVIGKKATKVRPGIKKANPELFEMCGRVSRSGMGEELEFFYKPLNCWRHISVYSPKRGYFAIIFKDITERKKAEAERELMIEFLRIANMATSTYDLIKASADFFLKQSGCEAVGIRLKEGDDYPYYETRGFPPEHVRLENKLCAIDECGALIRDFKGDPVLECMCGNVICGRFDTSKKFFTSKGSFWSNDTSRLLSSTTDKDRQTKTRNRCNGEGYESVALLALRVGKNRLGLLQLNDKRKNRFTLEIIQLWERIADHFALALSKTIAEELLRKYEQQSLNISKYRREVIVTDPADKQDQAEIPSNEASHK